MTFGYEFFIIFVMFLNMDQYREVSIQFVLPFIFIVVIDIICNIVCFRRCTWDLLINIIIFDYTVKINEKNFNLGHVFSTPWRF
ncbi:hypothetical protein ACJX0J_034453, partial [Zea mays]